MEPAPVVILVHGAWHGAWAWSAVVERLDGRGHPHDRRSISRARGLDTDALGDLHDDAETVRAAIARRGGTGARRGPLLRRAARRRGRGRREPHLLYLTAFMIEPGQSLLGLRDGVEPEWWVTSEDGRTLLPDDPVHVFYEDCAPEVAARAVAALVPQRKDAFLQETAGGRLAERAVDVRHLRARQRHPARSAGAHGDARRHRQPYRREPFAVPVAPRRGHGDHPGDARRGHRARLNDAGPRPQRLDELGGQPVVRGARRRAERARPTSCEHVRSALADGTGLRAAGAGHSFTPVVSTRRHRARHRRPAAASRTSMPARRRVTALPGTTVGEFGDPLWEAGLALANQGDIDTQAIAGAVATGHARLGHRAAELLGDAARVPARRRPRRGDRDRRDAPGAAARRAGRGRDAGRDDEPRRSRSSPAYRLARAHRALAVRRRARALGRALRGPPPLLVLLAAERALGALYGLATPAGQAMTDTCYVKLYDEARRRRRRRRARPAGASIAATASTRRTSSPTSTSSSTSCRSSAAARPSRRCAS